jgi:cytoskeletal protein CcmA (bactofilin family)
MAGESLHIKGDIVASEDLRFEGRIEGTISVPGHVLTIGAHAVVEADVDARAIVVAGHLSGAAVARERIELHETAVLEGTLEAKALVVRDGAIVRATVSMPERRKAQPVSAAPAPVEAAVA